MNRLIDSCIKVRSIRGTRKKMIVDFETYAHSCNCSLTVSHTHSHTHTHTHTHTLTHTHTHTYTHSRTHTHTHTHTHTQVHKAWGDHLKLCWSSKMKGSYI